MTVAAALLASACLCACASTSSSTSPASSRYSDGDLRDDGRSGRGDERPQPLKLPAKDQEDLECAEAVAHGIDEICGRKSSFPDGARKHALEEWARLRDECLPGMRSAVELRRFEECIDKIEEDPGQLDEATIQRRIDGREVAGTIRGDADFAAWSQEIRLTLKESPEAAWECKKAIEDGDLPRAKENCARWRRVEERYLKARRSIEGMMKDHGLDPSDGRALGMW